MPYSASLFWLADFSSRGRFYSFWERTGSFRTWESPMFGRFSLLLSSIWQTIPPEPMCETTIIHPTLWSVLSLQAFLISYLTISLCFRWTWAWQGQHLQPDFPLSWDPPFAYYTIAARKIPFPSDGKHRALSISAPAVSSVFRTLSEKSRTPSPLPPLTCSS